MGFVRLVLFSWHQGALLPALHESNLLQTTNKDETLEKVFKAYPESDMMRWTLDRSEDVYHSNHREPLGKGWVRGHRIPQHLGTEVPFGQCVNAKANTAVSLARQAIAPVDLEPEVRGLPLHMRLRVQTSVTAHPNHLQTPHITELCYPCIEVHVPVQRVRRFADLHRAECTCAPLQSLLQVADEVGTPAHDLYVRTHGAYAPGEQRKRNYNWNGTGAFFSQSSFVMDVLSWTCWNGIVRS